MGFDDVLPEAFGRTGVRKIEVYPKLILGWSLVIKKTRTFLEPQDVQRLFESAPQPSGFLINANGTFQFKTVAKKDDDEGEGPNDQPNAKRSLIRVCSPFKVIRKVEHLESDGSIARVSADCALIDSSGRYVFVTVDADKFLSSDLLKDLTSKGLRVFNGQSPLALLRSIYNELEPEVPTVRAVTRQGVQKSGSIVIDGLVIGDEDMIAKRAAEANAHDDAAANDALDFLRQEIPVPLGALRLEGRSPYPGDRNGPVFIHTPGNTPLLFVAPERLKRVLDGREEKAVKKLRERGVLVANGQPSSLRYTLNVDGEHRNFYAFDYTMVVGVGALQP